MPHVRGILPECWCCGRENQPHQARQLCIRCYDRWRKHGFAGAGPGPEWASQADRARDYADVITTLSAAEAARQLGRSARTITRWRLRLREAS